MVDAIERSELMRLKQRYVTRTRAAAGIRFILIIVSIVVLQLGNGNYESYIFSNPLENWSWLCLAIIFAGAVASHFLADNEVHGRWFYFATLLLDLAWCIYLIIFSRGLASPLMVVVPLFILLFSILFPGPTALIPPLLALPIITFFDLMLPQNYLSLSTQIGLLITYTMMNGVIIHVTNYILSREESQSREIFQLETKLKRLAILEERNRLSREIHDGIGGTLSGLIIQTEFLLTIPIQNNIITQELKELKRTAEEAMDEMRCSISMMRNEFDLVLQLQNCCEVFQARHKLPTRFAIEGTPATFSAEKQLTIFRIMQECLINSSKHAKANNIDVQIKFSKNALKMHVIDDGSGFNPKIIPQNHYGILNIKERAKKIGGDVNIHSTPGHGTCISLTLND